MQHIEYMITGADAVIMKTMACPLTYAESCPVRISRF